MCVKHTDTHREAAFFWFMSQVREAPTRMDTEDPCVNGTSRTLGGGGGGNSYLASRYLVL